MHYQRRHFNCNYRNQPDVVKQIIRNNISAIKHLIRTNIQECSLSDQNMRTSLHLAASLGRTQILELLIKSECYSNVNPRDSDMITPLHLACRNNHEAAVQLLLSYSADINSRSRLNVTPLHVCAAFNSIECAKLLLTSIININFTDSFGATALHYAVYNNSHSILELLVKHGAQTNVQDKHGQRPIHYAAIADNAYAIKILVEHGGANVNVRNKDLMTPLHFAVSFKSEKAFFELLEFNANLEAQDIHGNRPIHWAAFIGNHTIFDELFRRTNINIPNNEGMFPIHYACLSSASFGRACQILNSDANSINIVDKHKRTPLHFAAMNNMETIVTELLNRGANCDVLDSNLDTPLHKARSKAVIEVLAKKGSQIRMANKEGFTPLHLTVISALPFNCKLLIDADADPLMPDNKGRTSHYFCVIRGSIDCFFHIMTSSHYISKITSIGMASNFNVMPLVDSYGRSILHYAAASNQCSHEFIEFLLGKRWLPEMNMLDSKVHRALSSTLGKLNINQRDHLGRTALHYICMRAMDIENDVQFLVQLLIKAGADISVLDQSNRLPFHYAVMNGYIKTFCLLIRSDWLVDFDQYNHFFVKCCPLKLAAYCNQPLAIKELIGYGFNNFNQAILLAAQQSHWNCVLKLMNYLNRFDVFHRLAMIAAYNGNQIGLKIFLNSKGFDLDMPDEQGRTLMMMSAICSTGKATIESLINAGASLQSRDNKGRNALFYAIFGGSLDSVELLINNGIHLVKDANGKTIMHLIFAKGNSVLLDLIVNLSKIRRFFDQLRNMLFEKDENGFTPLQIGCVKKCNNLLAYSFANFKVLESYPLLNFAAFSGNYDLVYNLLQNQSLFNELGPKNRNVLHYACMSTCKNQEMIKLLLDKGIDANSKDEMGLTPLLCAASVGNSATVAFLLLNTKVNPLETDFDGNTILHLACLSGNELCAYTVLALSKHLNFLDKILFVENGLKQTCLHLSAKKCLKNVTQKLLRLNVPVNSEDINGYTPSLFCAKDWAAAYCLMTIESYMHYELVQNTADKLFDELYNEKNSSSTQITDSITLSRPNLKAIRQSLPGVVMKNTASSQELNFHDECSELIKSREQRLSLNCDNSKKQSLRFSVKRKFESGAEITDQEALIDYMKNGNSNNTLVDSDSELY